MLEALIPIGVAACTGLGVVTSKLHSRIHDLDRRLDNMELRIAETYLTKSEFRLALERVEAHMVRIENKLDTIASK